MASRFTVVGLNNYFPNSEKFLKELHEGDLLTLRMEPENPYTPTATIGVYQTSKARYIGHVASSDLDILMSYFNDDPEKELKFRYSRNNERADSFRVELSSKSERIEYVSAVSNVAIPTSAIIFTEPPFIMPEERALTCIYKRIISLVNSLLDRDVENDITKSLAKELSLLLDEYLRDWARLSLSLECKSYQISIQHAIATLLSISNVYSRMFDSYYQDISRIVQETRHGVNVEEIYQRQMVAVANGIEQFGIMDIFHTKAFSIPNLPTHQEIGDIINDINVWLRKMPPGIAQNYSSRENVHELARAICNTSFSYKELYMLYAHIVMRGILNEMLDYMKENGEYVDCSNMAEILKVIVRKVEKEIVVEK